METPISGQSNASWDYLDGTQNALASSMFLPTHGFHDEKCAFDSPGGHVVGEQSGNLCQPFNKCVSIV